MIRQNLIHLPRGNKLLHHKPLTQAAPLRIRLHRQQLPTQILLVDFRGSQQILSKTFLRPIRSRGHWLTRSKNNLFGEALPFNGQKA
jgi:hypothetical protein